LFNKLLSSLSSSAAASSSLFTLQRVKSQRQIPFLLDTYAPIDYTDESCHETCILSLNFATVALCNIV